MNRPPMTLPPAPPRPRRQPAHYELLATLQERYVENRRRFEERGIDGSPEEQHRTLAALLDQEGELFEVASDLLKTVDDAAVWVIRAEKAITDQSAIYMRLSKLIDGFQRAHREDKSYGAIAGAGMALAAGARVAVIETCTVIAEFLGGGPTQATVAREEAAQSIAMGAVPDPPAEPPTDPEPKPN